MTPHPDSPKDQSPSTLAEESDKRRSGHSKLVYNKTTRTIDTVLDDHSPTREAARSEALREAAEVARNACLIPPDGGSPTEAERLVCERAASAILALQDRATGGTTASSSFQERVWQWGIACFGDAIFSDRDERNHRFIEEALELVQACGATASEAWSAAWSAGSAAWSAARSAESDAYVRMSDKMIELIKAAPTSSASGR